MLDIADVILCAEHVHQQFVVDKFDKKYLNKIETLLLADTDEFMSPQLISRLEEKFKV